MPKFVVIGIIVVIVIGAIGGVVFFVQQRSAGENIELIETEKTNDTLFGVLQPASDSDLREGLTDDDNDGLVKNEEVFWKTDPNNPDTDGDGYLDGEEVAARHDPTIPAPNDKLPDEQTTLIADESEQRRYLEGEVNLYVSSGNMTEKYEQQPASAKTTMEAFANEQPIARLLPPVDSSLIPAGVPNTKSSIIKYVLVANNKTAIANKAGYNQAQIDLKNNSAAAMQKLASVLREYREDLLEVPVPVGAIDLHKLLLSHSEAMAITFDQIALRGDDPVKSLVATRQLEVLDRKYYPIIREELQQLQQLRASLAGTSN